MGHFPLVSLILFHGYRFVYTPGNAKSAKNAGEMPLLRRYAFFPSRDPIERFLNSETS